MKNHRSLIFYILGIVILSSIFYFVGRKDEKINTIYKDKIVYKDSIKIITKTIQGKEKEVIRYQDKIINLKEKEKQIIYDSAICSEIVSNLKEQINNQDTIIIKKDSIIFLTNDIIKYQDKIINIKPNRFGIGLQTGAAITPDKIQPYVGVGLSYNLIRF